MAISKIILNGTTQMDTTQVTVDSSNLLFGYTALGRDGETLTGTTTFPVQSVNNKTGAVVLNASDVGAEPEALVVNVTQSGSTYSADKTYVQITTAAAAGKRVYAVYFGAVFIYAGSTGSPAGDVGFERMFSMGSATFTVTTANVWKYNSTSLGTYTRPSGGIPAIDLASAVQTSLGKADTALQTAPVSSVNGQTGAVSLSIPSTAADVGAIAAPANPSSAQDLVYLNGAWVAADKVYIVNCTPTALDFSGTMDKTVAEIYAAYQAGKTIVFRVWASASEFADVTATMVGTNDNYNYPSFNAFIIMDAYNVIAYAYTSTTDNGSKATYHTIIYPISTSACIPAPSSPATGAFLVWDGSAWTAQTLATWQGGNY